MRIKNGKDPNLCNEDGCFEPRYKTEKRVYQKCETHMRALWRQYNSGDEDYKRTPPHRKPAAAPLSTSEARWGGVCPLCRRSLIQAAHMALHAQIYCSTCTPLSIPRAELEARLLPKPIRESSGYDTQKLRSQRDDLQLELAEARRQIDALRETLEQSRGLQGQPGDHKIVIIDYAANQLHYLVCDQQASQAMPATERDLIEQLNRDAVDGFLIARHPQMDVIL